MPTQEVETALPLRMRRRVWTRSPPSTRFQQPMIYSGPTWEDSRRSSDPPRTACPRSLSNPGSTSCIGAARADMWAVRVPEGYRTG